MNSKAILLLALAAASLAPAAVAQHIDVGVDIRLGRAQPPPPPEVIVIDNSGPSGPPPWAATRSRWYQRSYGYYPPTYFSRVRFKHDHDDRHDGRRDGRDDHRDRDRRDDDRRDRDRRDGDRDRRE
jgi:hypothetical protein